MRGKQFCGPRQQAHRVPCPYCGKRFTDVLRHLNHRESKCTSWFTTPSTHTHSTPPASPSFIDHTDDELPSPFFTNSELHEYTTQSQPHPELTPEPPKPLHVEFTGAGQTFGRAKSFINRFYDDNYTSYRVQNSYYPFADQVEWELASFLLGSGMSMQKVDEFLKLKLVRLFFFASRLTHSFPLRLGMLGLRSTLPKDCGAGLRCCQAFQIGSSRRSPLQDTRQKSQCSFSTATPSIVLNTYSGTPFSRTTSIFALSDSIRTQSRQSVFILSG